MVGWADSKELRTAGEKHRSGGVRAVRLAGAPMQTVPIEGERAEGIRYRVPCGEPCLPDEGRRVEPGRLGVQGIQEGLARGDSIIIAGFGTFSTTSCPTRRGRNPREGESVDNAARQHPPPRPAIPSATRSFRVQVEVYAKLVGGAG